MARKFYVLALLIFTEVSSFAQEATTVTETTFKIDGNDSQILYFGFAKGDQIIFNLKVEKGRYIDDFEILELPGTTRYSDLHIKKIKGKRITIPTTGIYRFKVSNAKFKQKTCHLTIQRIPSSTESQNFNTTVYWRTVNDTTFKEKTEKYLMKSDTSVVDVVDRVSKVHSQTNANGSKESTKFRLPKHTVSWSYYVGVNQEGQKAYEDAASDLAKLAPKVASIPQIGPMAALALGLTHYLPVMQKGEDINFYICDYENAVKFRAGEYFSSIRNGLVINDFSRVTTIIDGDHFVCLSNDNAFDGVSVMIKITAIVVEKEWGTRTVRYPVVTQREEAYLMN